MKFNTTRFITKAVLTVLLLVTNLVLFIYLLNELSTNEPHVAFVAIVSNITGAITGSLIQAVGNLFTEPKDPEPEKIHTMTETTAKNYLNMTDEELLAELQSRDT